jgi:regulator of sigma E protease
VWVALYTGMPKVVERELYNNIASQVVIAEVIASSPSESAGLKVGDKVLGINGQNIVTAEQLVSLIKEQAGQVIDVLVEDTQTSLQRHLSIKTDHGNEKRGPAGFYPVDFGVAREGFLQAFGNSFIVTWEYLRFFGSSLYSLFSGPDLASNIGGPIAIATQAGKAARMGIGYLLNLMILLSINLVVINILPIPALDGGRLVFIIWEKIAGKPFRYEGVLHAIFFTLLLLLMLLVTIKDLVRIG